MKTRMIAKALLLTLPVTCMQYGHASSQSQMQSPMYGNNNGYAGQKYMNNNYANNFGKSGYNSGSQATLMNQNSNLQNVQNTYLNKNAYQNQNTYLNKNAYQNQNAYLNKQMVNSNLANSNSFYNNNSQAMLMNQNSNVQNIQNTYQNQNTYLNKNAYQNQNTYLNKNAYQNQNAYLNKQIINQNSSTPNNQNSFDSKHFEKQTTVMSNNQKGTLQNQNNQNNQSNNTIILKKDSNQNSSNVQNAQKAQNVPVSNRTAEELISRYIIQWIIKTNNEYFAENDDNDNDLWLLELAKYLYSPQNFETEYHNYFFNGTRFHTNTMDWKLTLISYLILDAANENGLENFNEGFKKGGGMVNTIYKLAGIFKERAMNDKAVNEVIDTAARELAETNREKQKEIQGNITEIIHSQLFLQTASDMSKKLQITEKNNGSAEAVYPLVDGIKLVCKKDKRGTVKGKLVAPDGQVLISLEDSKYDKKRFNELDNNRQYLNKFAGTVKTITEKDPVVKNSATEQDTSKTSLLLQINTLNSALALIKHSPACSNLVSNIIDTTLKNNMKLDQKDIGGALLLLLNSDFQSDDWDTYLAIVRKQLNSIQGINHFDVNSVCLSLINALCNMASSLKIPTDTVFGANAENKPLYPIDVHSGDTYEIMQRNLAQAAQAKGILGDVLVCRAAPGTHQTDKYKVFNFPPYLEVNGDTYLLIGYCTPGIAFDEKEIAEDQLRTTGAYLFSSENIRKFAQTDIFKQTLFANGVLAMYERADGLGILNFKPALVQKVLDSDETEEAGATNVEKLDENLFDSNLIS